MEFRDPYGNAIWRQHLFCTFPMSESRISIGIPNNGVWSVFKLRGLRDSSNTSTINHKCYSNRNTKCYNNRNTKCNSNSKCTVGSWGGCHGLRISAVDRQTDRSGDRDLRARRTYCLPKRCWRQGKWFPDRNTVLTIRSEGNTMWSFPLGLKLFEVLYALLLIRFGKNNDVLFLCFRHSEFVCWLAVMAASSCVSLP
jgi:hypothetical protein